MIRVLKENESMTAVLMTKLGSDALHARELVYRLYHMREQKNCSGGAILQRASSELIEELKTVKGIYIEANIGDESI